ncbi:isoprenoid synthase domain-containing protein [Armillaria fumosa]|nr:isoprenoid synthase domain-containing protein [Armillaria fumosa]
MAAIMRLRVNCVSHHETAANWPWPHKINPLYEEVKAQSEAWFRLFEAYEAFSYIHTQYDFRRVEQLGTACDFMNLLFVFDEYTDSETPDVVRQYAEIVKDALRYPFKPGPSNEVVLGTVAQQYQVSLGQKSIVETFGRYMDSVVAQAEDRHQYYAWNVEDYFKIRRLTIGIDPSYAMLELGYDLPNEVFYDPTVVNRRRLACQLIVIDNDLASYNKEQASEKFPHNILVCVMSERKCDLNCALFGRYFGSNGSAIQQHRMVTLMPKQLSMDQPLLIHTQR